MIITRSPLRISLGGGGTDLPSYYRDHTGFLIAAAIDKFVYITIHQAFVDEFIVKYSKLERVKHPDEVEHPIIREALKLVAITAPYLEITSMADIPAGTGLGSSGSFTTALLKALHTLKKNLIHPEELAEQACYIEIERLGEFIGKQDQYIAAYGGITCFKFLPDGKVEAWPLNISSETLYNLEDNLLLFFTGYSRSASAILKEQDVKSQAKDLAMIENLHFVKEMGFRSKEAFESGNLREFASIMNEHWHYKKKRSANMSNSHIDDLYELALGNGALGGKLIGAGGGGFLMFYTEEKSRLRHAMFGAGLKEVRFRFDFEGTKVVTQS
ncbi:MAG: galactokinase [Syntrophobacteraceae bacterium]|jgi:D-glycero-alpha-D-manno-heptose-7-phosphate kinase